MRPALHKSTSIKKPATTKYMNTSNTMKKSITNIHEDYFNVEEMMTKNKIRKLGLNLYNSMIQKYHINNYKNKYFKLLN